MKVGLVGLGYWGSKLVRNLVHLVLGEDLVVIDKRVESLDTICRQYPNVACAFTLEEALTNHELDAVVIATPVETHAPLARTALESGCHVFVEKPLAGSTDDAIDLVALADNRSRVLMVGHTFLFSPRVEWVKEYVDRGGCGSMYYVTSSRLNLGSHRNDVNVIWDLAPHDFSIVFYLLGEFPTLVRATARSVVRPRVPDVAFIGLTFPSGTIASIDVSWLAPRKVRNTVLVGEQRMVVYDDTDPDEPVKVYDKGVVRHDEATFGEHQLTYRYGDTIAPHVAVHEPLTVELQHFLACVRGEEVCRSDGEFGLRVVEALEAADRSWRLGGVPIGLGEAKVIDVRNGANSGART